MAALYLGRKTGAGGFAKYVAIKVLLDHMSEDPNFVSMFLDEARLSARIEHPNVVHIHGLGEEDGQHFLIMEYVAGCSLAQLQRAMHKQARRYAPTVVAFLGMQVAAGLHAAHEATDDNGESLHVVHRDVSPKNILVAFKGYVKLIDFGIAKVRDATSQNTSAGALKGTIRYMSPEQAFGRPIDRRSDIFALGIVLWEMLAGRTLFDAESDFAVLDQVRTANVPALSQITKVPPALERVVMKMLKLNPSDRFSTADEVQRALAMAVPEALSFSPQKLGELVGALLPSVPSGQEIDPSIASALGRPMALANAEEVLRRLAATVDTPSQVGVVSNHALAEQLAARAEYDALMDDELTSVVPSGSQPLSGETFMRTPSADAPLPLAAPLSSSARMLDSHPSLEIAPKSTRWWLLPAAAVAVFGLIGAAWGIGRLSAPDAPTVVTQTTPVAPVVETPPTTPQVPSHDIATSVVTPTPEVAPPDEIPSTDPIVGHNVRLRRRDPGTESAGSTTQGSSAQGSSAQGSSTSGSTQADSRPAESQGTRDRRDDAPRQGRPTTHVTDQPLISNTF